MILPIAVIGHPVLRKKAKEIDSTYPNINTLIDNMFETMVNANGVGLAAPQVGKSIQLIVIDATPMAEDDPTVEGFKIVLINPKLLEAGTEVEPYNEGCLSIPGFNEDVLRPNNIKLEYYDADFVKHTEDFEGLKARIIQHEMDHLQGILFSDRLSAIKRQLSKNKLVAISKGKFERNYKVSLS